MAYVVWRVLMKKYAKVRLGIQSNPPLDITPSTRRTKSYDDDAWKSQDETLNLSANFSALSTATLAVDTTTINVGSCVGGLDEILSNPNDIGHSGVFSRGEFRKSKVKMKSYLRRCKEAIIGAHVEETCPITHEAVQQVSNSSWYVDDNLNEIVAIQSTEVIEPLKNGDEDANVVAKEIQNNVYSNGIEILIDEFFGHLYPDYVNHTRTVLIRQARDILVCTFHGDLAKFEEIFLKPAADIVGHLKDMYLEGMNLCWRNGWPLAVSGALVLHLGSLDESHVRCQDIYLCIKPDTNEANKPKLYAVWRKDQSKTSKITYHELDPGKDPITPLALEMLTEDLPHLLENLLVGIERAICRISLDELVFPLNNKDIVNEKDRQNNNEVKADSDTNNSKITRSDYDDIENNNCINTNLSTSMPLFCLGGSFPHIDSDEESGDDMKSNENVSVTSQQKQDNDIVAPRSIQEIPEKLLTSGIFMPGTCDRLGSTIIFIDAEKITSSGLNCYEIATILLYYKTIPVNSVTFTIHLFANDSAHLAFLDTLDSSLQLIQGHVKFNSILVSGSYDQQSDKLINAKDNIKNYNLCIKYLNNETIKNFVSTDNLLIKCCGFFVHDQNEWIDFIKTLESLQKNCVDTGRKLVSVLSDVKNSDTQSGQVSRRQLHSQHRALSRALMDSELQSLRRKGPNVIQSLQDKLKVINNSLTLQQTKNLAKLNSCSNSNSNNSHNASDSDYINRRLNEVLTIYDEVDRAAKKLEHLTEQRRERLREMTRQRALDDEMNEVITWIRNDGEKSLAKYTETAIDNEDLIKDIEQDFEKFYFVSKKNVARGKSLCDASNELEIMKENSGLCKDVISSFNEKLELLHERIESASRLHHFFNLHDSQMDENIRNDMLKLAERLNLPILIERCKNIIKSFDVPPASCYNNNNSSNDDSSSVNISLNENDESIMSNTITVTEKTEDSGVGSFCRCEDHDDPLVRTCSCQSFDDSKIIMEESNNSELDEDCFESAKQSLESLQLPLQANAHLYCHTSQLQLDYEELDIFDQKTQKTLLLIMREMIGTERDYVRSLQYVINNYMQELLREDIPQALRGQRNAVFGNIEKISEFHQQHFLNELERYESSPLKVGAAFLRHESKFYLYALYNKNKPKSDSLMSEYGTQFFKPKQLELNDKMDLASYLLKPVQRMGKYALLLQQLMKACANVQNITNQQVLEDLDELQKAEEMVRFQLRHGNDLLAMDSLRDCDVNVKEQGRLLRQSEFLVWEGKAGKKCLRQVFLFEELVLFSKARRFPDRKNLDIYIYKNSIKTSDIGLTAHIGDSPHKFEIWFRKMKPGDTWTLQAMTEDIKNAWTEEVSRLLWKQATRNREIRLAEMSSMGIGSKPCLDIRPSEDQINDRSISISQLGKATKLRSSFSSTLSADSKSKRPNSIISVSSSSSSGGSCIGTSTTSSSSTSGCDTTMSVTVASSVCESTSTGSVKSIITASKKLTLNLHDTTVEPKANHRKHQRSTTLISQCSMESGIIADITLSPDECPDNTIWHHLKHKELKHSNSLGSTTNAAKKVDEKSSNQSKNNSSIASDSITVHL